ncbi:PREDICTED: GDT1-like protein 1, chloroplastic isoform X2 [Camelina sativa]|uniref:GDT1 family protein n=1 Tax=Camelina sativa TaxID=90675 RepID=A0ABM0WNI6_CAMSA|nr:PREDICTED: GDT1-like protein 1, chloroplastic isoform X2 [Camelina sativa]
MLTLNLPDSIRLLPFQNPRPPKSDSCSSSSPSSSSSRRCLSTACPIPIGFRVRDRCFSRGLSQLRRNDSQQLGFRCFRRNAACYIEKADSEENDRNLDVLVERRIAHSRSEAQRVLKFLAVSGSVALLGNDPAFAASSIANGTQSLVTSLGDLGDISSGFASAFLLIFFSELGDKTFFIAALLAARNSAATVFVGTFGALGIMTIISVVLGRTFHYVDEILPFRFGETDLPLDNIAAVCLLVYFGVSTLLDAASDEGKAEEEQKEAELAVSEFSGNGAGIVAAASTIVSTFALVFVAEWGDKSFFSTIALAAAASPLGVIAGALAGHGAATLLAVLGGSLLGNFLSEKAIAYVGGVLFLVFAAVTVAEIVT